MDSEGSWVASFWRETRAKPTRAHTIFAILVLLWFWGTALLIALNDIDFFSMQDLLDTSRPHHEHIVIALLFCGILVSAVIFLRGRPHQNPT